VGRATAGSEPGWAHRSRAYGRARFRRRPGRDLGSASVRLCCVRSCRAVSSRTAVVSQGGRAARPRAHAYPPSGPAWREGPSQARCWALRPVRSRQDPPFAVVSPRNVAPRLAAGRRARLTRRSLSICRDGGAWQPVQRTDT